jgi:threonine dehydratase
MTISQNPHKRLDAQENPINFLPAMKQFCRRILTHTKRSYADEPVKNSCCRDPLKSTVINYDMIREAFHRIKQAGHESTPLTHSDVLSQQIEGGNTIYLKEEQKHRTGSYKERGAMNKICSLTSEEKDRGVITNSAGNHGQAVAYQASKMGIKATVVMPELTPFVKVNGTKQWGANVVLKGNGFDEAFQVACGLCRENNYTFIHAFNDVDIIAGQGTLGLELLEQNPYINTVLVPIGGGGLISGVALALKTINPKIKIYGVETETMPKMSTSIKNGHVTHIPFVPSIADGIAVKRAGDLNFNIVKEYVDDIVTVSEDDIAYSVMTLLEKEKTMAEGAGAVALASLLSKKLQFKNRNIACIISGGNIDVSLLRTIIDRGLVTDGRMIRIRIEVRDVPGQLAQALTLLGNIGCNVLDVGHDRSFYSIPIGYTAPLLTLQTRGKDHWKEIHEALSKATFIRKYVLFTTNEEIPDNIWNISRQ